MRDLNPDLIRLVASRFDELRGLQTAGDAGMLLLFCACMFAGRAMDDGRFGAVGLTVIMMILCAAFIYWISVLRRRVDRYYIARFGRVGSKRYVPPHVLWFMCATNWMGMWCTVPGPAWVRAPLALAVAIPLMAWPAWIARRDAPLRAHWAIVAIALIVITLQMPITDAAAQPLWRTRALLYGGVAFLIAGLGDHLLLLRAMPFRPQLDGEGERA